jgi:hypothetical protein
LFDRFSWASACDEIENEVMGEFGQDVDVVNQSNGLMIHFDSLTRSPNERTDGSINVPCSQFGLIV